MEIIPKESLETLRSVMCGLRSITPVSSFSPDRAASSDIRTGYLDGRPVRRLVITLRGPGCEWVSRGGGCIMCGHYAGTTRGVVPSVEDTVSQFQREIALYDLENINVISIYNSGSVLNPAELHFEALRRIFSLIGKMPSIGKVVIETRAEFVCQEKISELLDILGPKRTLSIAMGLETADDNKRDLCVNKGCTLKEIECAVRVLKGLTETQLYILLGLPFLPEAEVIDDTIHSIRCAQKIGADEIHIEPATLQQYTLTYYLAGAGLYRLPSLYSLYEVLRAVVPEIKPYVSPFLHMPLPEKVPGGCPLCTENLIHGLLHRYNIERSRVSLEYDTCTCLPEWRKRLKETDTRPLPVRVMDALSKLSLSGQFISHSLAKAQMNYEL